MPLLRVRGWLTLFPKVRLSRWFGAAGVGTNSVSCVQVQCLESLHGIMNMWLVRASWLGLRVFYFIDCLGLLGFCANMYTYKCMYLYLYFIHKWSLWLGTVTLLPLTFFFAIAHFGPHSRCRQHAFYYRAGINTYLFQGYLWVPGFFRALLSALLWISNVL